MKRHEFDPTLFVLGLAFAALGLFFLLGDRTAADIGWKWMWPVPVVLLGLLFVISATRRVIAQREVAAERADEEREVAAERADEELEPPDEVGP